MTAWYNEVEPYAAQWLRNLVLEGLIAPGDVDTRSIADVRPGDLAGYTQCHFFAGLGGWSGALRLAGWDDDRPVWTGSCPCQPFSLAGKQQGFADPRHLWPHWRRLIAQCRPAIVLGEQVASASQWLRLVRGDLEALGYAVGVIPVEAASAGADHLRDRYWFVGHDTSERRREGRPEHAIWQWSGPAVTGDGGAIDVVDTIGERGRGGNGKWQDATYADPPGQGSRVADADQFGACEAMGHADSTGWNGTRQPGQALPQSSAVERSGGRGSGDYEWVIGADGKARRVKPGIRLLADGIPARVAKLRALGNAIDLRPAAAFIKAIGD